MVNEVGNAAETLAKIPWQEFHDLLNANSTWNSKFEAAGFGFLQKHGLAREPTKEDQLFTIQHLDDEALTNVSEALPNNTDAKQRHIRVNYLQLQASHEFELSMNWIHRLVMQQDLDKVVLDCVRDRGMRCARRELEFLITALFYHFGEDAVLWFAKHCSSAHEPARFSKELALKMLHLGLQMVGLVPRQETTCSLSADCDTKLGKPRGAPVDRKCSCSPFEQLDGFLDMMDWLTLPAQIEARPDFELLLSNVQQAATVQKKRDLELLATLDVATLDANNNKRPRT